MQLTSNSFADGETIPGEFSFCVFDPVRRVALGNNVNPHLAWSGAPENTRSFVITCVDPDVPSQGDDVNQEGKTVPASLPRVDFFHWILVDLPPTVSQINAGEFSKQVTPRGKPGPHAAHAARQGVNNYTDWFAADNDMRGDYYGYDGPCPPWNDELLHHYVFTVYALDIETLPLEGKFGGSDVRAAMAGHILAEASLTGIYSLNPALAN